MEITLSIFNDPRQESTDAKAQRLLLATGAHKFGGNITALANGKYRFDVPQAFTEGHPAIRYLIEHA